MKIYKFLPILIAAFAVTQPTSQAQESSNATEPPKTEAPAPEKPATPEPRRPDLDNFFDNVDADKDGKISKEEYTEHAKRETEVRFKRVDKNEDGSIDKEEFQQALRQQRSNPARPQRGSEGFRRPEGQGPGDRPEGFRRPERGERGERPEGGFRRPEGPRGEGEGRRGVFFQNWDKDGDGVVTKEEFQAANAEQFDRLDRDGDGKLSGDELRPRRGPGGEGAAPPPRE